MQPDTVSDSSDRAGSGVAKSYRQNFCAALPGRAVVALSICAEKSCAPRNRLTIRLELFECSFDTAILVDVYFTSALENLVLKGYI